MPDSPAAVRIDRFIERHFGTSPRYERLPGNVLGLTEFGRDGVKAIVVTATLDAEGSTVAERRIRTTLAHEAGHGLLHARLFKLGEKPRSLFGDGHNRPEIMCRDVLGAAPETRTYDGKWWEYQANRAIGGLLMPRHLVYQAVEPFCGPAGRLGLPSLDEALRERATRQMAELFDVNPVVARLRLAEIFPIPEAGQISLL